MDVKGSSWNQLRTFIFKSVGCKVKKHTQQDVNSYHIQMYKVMYVVCVLLLALRQLDGFYFNPMKCQ